jgi:hypothetical protein
MSISPVLTGNKNWHFELNASLFSGKEGTDAITLQLIVIGYRYQKPVGGFVFKVKIEFLNIGFGVGYAF